MTPYDPHKPPPFLRAEENTPKYTPEQAKFLKRLDALEAAVARRNDDWTRGFLEGVRKRIENGTALSPKQKDVLRKKLQVYRVAARIARRCMAQTADFSTTPMGKQTAIKRLYKLIGRTVDGFFSDSYWQPIQKVFDIFRKAGVDFAIDETFYRKDSEGNPSGKQWNLTLTFTDNRGRTPKIYGMIAAAGAGSVEDPLDRYDVTITFS